LRNLRSPTHPTNRREEFRNAHAVKLGIARRHCILSEDQIVALLEPDARCRFYTDVRRDAAQHDRLNPAAAKLNVEIRSIERAGMVLRDDDVGGFRAQVRKNLRPVRTGIDSRTLEVGDWTREQNPAWTRVDANENDERLTRPKMAREVGRPRDDVSGRVRYSGRRDDAALQVDDDERRRARIECEFAHAQSSWRKNEFARDVGDRRAPTQRHRQIHLAANMLQHRSHAGLAAECQPP